ncbi:MAG: regulatory iron-sulfur-containing complex subunit RicT [Candidatus Berkelbacteria bacterium]|nr:regulatory iron-sulfur-containing complex subunit RicT [Candidatus Berkelbacteria bacterium]
MAKVTVKIKSSGQTIEVDSGKFEFVAGDWLLVETRECKEVAIVVDPPAGGDHLKESKSDDQEGGEPEIEIIRKLSGKDLEQYNEYKKMAQGLIPECQKKIEFHNLPMELMDAELSFDEKKLTFYFAAEGRVDFRSLVSDLASTFKKLIRLQQIGARDEARFIGGCGRCGQVLCCRRFLKGDLDSVTLDMAQIQGLAVMGSNRVTGCCGKLMCCLKYELEEYKEAAKNLPKIGEKIKTEKGPGFVISQNVLAKKVLVEVEDGTKLEVEC